MIYRSDTPKLVTDRPREEPAAEERGAPQADGLEGVYPGASYGAGADVQGVGTLFLILERHGSGPPKVHRCRDAREVQETLEALLSDGAQQEELELFRASNLPFSVSFRPVVRFPASE